MHGRMSKGVISTLRVCVESVSARDKWKGCCEAHSQTMFLQECEANGPIV